MGVSSRSLLLLLALYGLVFAVGDAYLLHGGAPIWVGIAFAVGIVGLQYVLSPWLIEWCFDISWYEDDIPARLRLYIEQLCKQRGLPMPKIGIIESGTPNAFAFGRLRSDARLVVTRGLLDLLTEEEVEAVAAHEVGHIAHYDFAVMAVAAMAPLLLYQLHAHRELCGLHLLSRRSVHRSGAESPARVRRRSLLGVRSSRAQCSFVGPREDCVRHGQAERRSSATSQARQ